MFKYILEMDEEEYILIQNLLEVHEDKMRRDGFERTADWVQSIYERIEDKE